MATDYVFREFQENQRHTLAQAVRVYQDYVAAGEALRPLKGGMHWKKINGREYLYRYRDRYGHGHSLGPRSPDTEGLLAAYGRERREAAVRLDTCREQLDGAARFCRAAQLHRAPHTVARILRRLNLGDLTGALPLVMGVQALHAYEFAAGVFIDAPKTSPFWSGADRRLTLLAAAAVSPTQLLGLLRRADRSFTALPGEECAAVNKAGFAVRCLRPPARRPPHQLTAKATPAGAAAASGGLTALLSAPRFSQVVIGTRGDPVTMTVPDPRALALHQLWLSQQEDRTPADKARYRIRAMALAELILRYLPQYDFFSADLHRFPPEVVRHAQGLVEGYESSPDLKVES